MSNETEVQNAGFRVQQAPALPGDNGREIRGAGFTVRPLSRADVPAAQALIRRVIHEEMGLPYVPRFHFDVDQMEEVYLRTPRQALFVAVDDASGRVIGTSGVRTGGPTSPPFAGQLARRYQWDETAQLFRVYVDREHRRRGAASALVEAARRFVAADGGYRDLILHSDLRHDGAEGFWRSVARLTFDGRVDGTPGSSVYFELPLNLPLPKYRATAESVPDWQDWLSRWERQQSSYIAFREERFEAMLEILGALMPRPFVVLDLMCGPGAIARRVVERFPAGATVIAADLDPVLMELGMRAIGDAGGRIRWVQVDFNDLDWPEQLGIGQVDAVVSTTAIHWLRAGGIVDLYRSLARVVKPGGIVMNGDQMDFVEAQPVLRELGQTLREGHRVYARQLGAESWEDWWQALRREPALAHLLEERDRLFAWRPAASEKNIGSGYAEGSPVPQRHTHFGLHKAALFDAGFKEVDVVWQHLANRILMAVR